MPELLWKAYIDLEVEEGERERARALYERLLFRSGHVKVWIAYALFEGARIGGDEDSDEEGGDEADRDTGDPEKARSVFERGYEDLKGREWTDVCGIHDSLCGMLTTFLQRVALLEAWKAYEQEHGSSEQVAHVQSLMPQATKRRRKINDAGDMEECACI